MHDEAGERRLHVVDLDLGAAGADDALVGELAAALGVEGGAVEHDLDRRCPRPRPGPTTPSTSRPTTLGLGRGLVVAEELDLAGLLEQLARSTEMSALPVFLAAASALARSRCSFISRRKPSSSTWSPCSAAISRVRSIGKP